MSTRIPTPDILRGVITERYHRTCQYCGATSPSYITGPGGLTWHIDHIVPLVNGGSNDESNLTLACAACNLRKHAQPADGGWRERPRVARRTSSTLSDHAPRVDGFTAQRRIIAYFRGRRGAEPRSLSIPEIAFAVGLHSSSVRSHISMLVGNKELIEDPAHRSKRCKRVMLPDQEHSIEIREVPTRVVRQEIVLIERDEAAP